MNRIRQFITRWDRSSSRLLTILSHVVTIYPLVTFLFLWSLHSVLCDKEKRMPPEAQESHHPVSNLSQDISSCLSAGSDTVISIYPVSFSLLWLNGGDPGGVWEPPLVFDPDGDMYHPYFDGEGTFTYIQPNTDCPPDTATITINWLFDPWGLPWDITVECSGYAITATIPPFPGDHPDVTYSLQLMGNDCPAMFIAAGLSFDTENVLTFDGFTYICGCVYFVVTLDGVTQFGEPVTFFTEDLYCVFGFDPVLPDDEFCQNDPSMILPETQYNEGYAGNWSGLGVEDNVFDPSDLEGVVTLTFTPNDSCYVPPLFVDVTVYVITISGVPESLCETDSPFPLPQSQNGVTGEWSGPGVSNNVFDPSGLDGTVELVFTPDEDICDDPVTTQIEILPGQVPELSGLPGTVCALDEPIGLPIMQDGFTGNWSGPGVSNNVFDPAGLSGDVSLTFTPEPGQCASAVQATIHVQAGVLPLITGIPDSLCEDDESIVLPDMGGNISGVWSGDGVTNNTFDPTNQDGDVLLTFTPDADQCALTMTDTIHVSLPTFVLITSIPDSLCENSGPIDLSTINNGVIGNWSGEGVNNNVFDPSGIDDFATLVFLPDEGQCALPTEIEIFVDDLTIPDITGVPGIVCTSSPPVILPVLQNGVSGEWSGPGVIMNTFYPNGLSDTITLLFSPDSNSCAANAYMSIILLNETGITITGVPDSLCQTGGTIALPVIQSNIPGVWSGQGVTNSSFDPTGLSGDILLTFAPDTGYCASTANVYIQVETRVIPLIEGIPASVCQLDAAVNLPVTLNGIQGTWSGTGVTTDIFTPAGLSDTVQITFTPDTGQCATSVSALVIVSEAISPTITGIPSSLCNGAPAISLPGVLDGISGYWSGPGISQDTFAPQGLIGNVQLSFIPDTGQCALTVLSQIEIVQPPAFANLQASCDSAAQFYTVSFDIIGGDPDSYTVNGNVIIGPQFVSAPISADSMSYLFMLDDANGCGPVIINGAVNCACATYAGTMDFTGSPLQICMSAGITVTHQGDELLDPDDLLLFVLHDNAGAQLGTIYATSNSTVFSVPVGVVPGQIYYLSAVAGSDNGNGSIDFTDPCLSVSQGIPVVFYQPEASIGAGDVICQSECVTYQVEVSGVAPFTLEYEVIANGDTSDYLLQSDENLISLTLCPADYDMTNGVLDVVLTNIIDNNCTIPLAVKAGSVTTVYGHTISDVEATLCADESIFVNGTEYNQSNPSGTEVLPGGNQWGCDSIINVSLTFYPEAEYNLNQTLCFGGSLTINGTVYTEQNPSGTETLMHASVNGCDSIVHVNLDFDSLVTETIALVLCPGEFVVVNGVVFDESNPSGTEVIPGGSALGCDSLVYVDLSYDDLYTVELNPVLCEGDSIEIYGTIYNAQNPSGKEIIPDINGQGCDSIIEIAVTFVPEAIGYVEETLDRGDSVIVGGSVYNVSNPSGIVVIPGGSHAGCDSTIIVMLHFTATEKPNLFIPTIFSPNGDGLNDVLTVFVSPAVTKIKVLRFFDRWGELVNEHHDFIPNVPGIGWDGTYKGNEMNPGVYVWMAEVEVEGDRIRMYSGDVTLIK